MGIIPPKWTFIIGGAALPPPIMKIHFGGISLHYGLRRGDSKLYEPVMEEYVPDSSENDEVSSLSFCSYGGCLTILLLIEELELEKIFLT